MYRMKKDHNEMEKNDGFEHSIPTCPECKSKNVEIKHSADHDREYYQCVDCQSRWIGEYYVIDENFELVTKYNKDGSIDPFESKLPPQITNQKANIEEETPNHNSKSEEAEDEVIDPFASEPSDDCIEKNKVVSDPSTRFGYYKKSAKQYNASKPNEAGSNNEQINDEAIYPLPSEESLKNIEDVEKEQITKEIIDRYCPKCKIYKIYFNRSFSRDNKNFIEYICGDCGKIWIEYIQRFCPKCTSPQIIFNASYCGSDKDPVEYKCQSCGKIWAEYKEIEDFAEIFDESSGPNQLPEKKQDVTDDYEYNIPDMSNAYSDDEPVNVNGEDDYKLQNPFED